MTIDGVVGQPWTHEGTRARISLGDLSRGDSRELVVKLTASGRRAGAAVEIMDAVVHYADATGGGDLEQRLFLGARAVDGSDLKSGKNDDVEKAEQRVEAAADTVEAIRLARAGDVPAAQKKIDAVNQNAPAADDATRRQRQELNDALPSLAPAKASPASGGAASMKSPPKPAPAVVRSMHDQAMQTLQGL